MDVYQVVTDRIISQLEKGTIPWRKPWIGGDYAWSRQSGKGYSLLNCLLLPYPGEYATFKQIAAEGGHINKGSKAKIVTYWNWLESKTEKDEEGNPKKIPFLKYYNVFHIERDTDLSVKHNKSAGNANPIECAEALAESYIRTSGVRFDNSGSSAAFYSMSTDSVTVPNISQFKEVEEYYSTLFHELTHSTGPRLKRDMSGWFGTEDYSKEELVAEIGSATILNSLGIETDRSFKNSAAYIANWLTVLRNDKKMIISAAGKAEKAVRLINGETQEQILAA